MWGIGFRPDEDYDLAKQLNSETVKKVEPQEVVDTIEYRGLGVGDH